MRLQDAKQALAETLAACARLQGHLERLAARLKYRMPLAETTLGDMADVQFEELQSFLRMFEQLQDLTAKPIFRGVRLLSNEDVSSMSMKAIVNRLEKPTAISSAEKWFEIAARCNLAWTILPVLLSNVSGSRIYIDNEGLAL
jgi:hypothetical protein